MAVAEGITATDLAAARNHARAVVARSGTSFGLGMRILSRQRRDAMFALYAFCREIELTTSRTRAAARPRNWPRLPSGARKSTGSLPGSRKSLPR